MTGVVARANIAIGETHTFTFRTAQAGLTAFAMGMAFAAVIGIALAIVGFVLGVVISKYR